MLYVLYKKFVLNYNVCSLKDKDTFDLYILNVEILLEHIKNEKKKRKIKVEEGLKLDQRSCYPHRCLRVEAALVSEEKKLSRG